MDSVGCHWSITQRVRSAEEGTSPVSDNSLVGTFSSAIDPTCTTDVLVAETRDDVCVCGGLNWDTPRHSTRFLGNRIEKACGVFDEGQGTKLHTNTKDARVGKESMNVRGHLIKLSRMMLDRTDVYFLLGQNVAGWWRWV